MSCKSLLYMVGMFVFVPVWIGLLWTDFLKIRERASQLLHAWVLGFATMLATAQLVLVPFVMMQKTLTQALLLWRIILQILAVLSFVIWLGRRAGTAETVADAAAGTADGAGVQKKVCGKAGTWTIVFGILVAVLILLQAYIPARYEHSDDDDSRFVAEEVSAVVHDTMYREDPITADYMYWDTGEVRKDLTSPWAMFVAMHAKEGNMAPAALSHAYLPFFLILICYALYLLIGQVLFGVLSLNLTTAKVENPAEDTEVDAELEAYILEKIEERKAAKKEKDFAKADAIRDDLLAKGIVLKDTREGVIWHKA